MQNYKLGVLLSAYNGEKYIAQQVESIMKQSNVEHITLLIRNDGSTDNTTQILEKLSKKYSNIRVINGTNVGLIASFFKLLEIAVKEYNFDYYSFSDQDDYWMKNKLKSAVSYLEKEDQSTPLLYGCRSNIIDENLQPTGFATQLKERKLTFFNTAIQNIIPGHNQVLNKKLARIVIHNTKDLSKIYSQDLWITNIAAVTGKILFDNTPHTWYRMHGNNQLGYGKSKSSRLFAHLARLKKKEAKKMSLQLQYFLKCYNTFLTNEEVKEIKTFFLSQKNILKRLEYIKCTKFYRQTSKETFLYKVLYLIGAYKLKSNESCEF